MGNALGRAAAELTEQLEKHGIEVFEQERRVHWRGVDKYIPYGTPKTKCRATLKKFITAAEKTEAKEVQEALL